VLLATPFAELEYIYASLGTEKQGIISEYLSDLESAGFVKRSYAFNFKKQALAKASVFRMSDNFMRFYLKYMEPNLAQISSGRFENSSLHVLKAWETMMGFQFENLVLGNRDRILEILHIKPNDVCFDDAYIQRKTKTQTACQVDYLIVDKFNTVWVCEVKFSKSRLGTKVIEELEKKIESLKHGGSYSYRPVLIHVNGVTDELVAESYFAKIIDFSALLGPTANLRASPDL